jgi:hypothetical protein
VKNLVRGIILAVVGIVMFAAPAANLKQRAALVIVGLLALAGGGALIFFAVRRVRSTPLPKVNMEVVWYLTGLLLPPLVALLIMQRSEKWGMNILVLWIFYVLFLLAKLFLWFTRQAPTQRFCSKCKKEIHEGDSYIERGMAVNILGEERPVKDLYCAQCARALGLTKPGNGGP